MITSFAILLVSMLFCLAALAAEVLWSKKAREKGRSRAQGVVAPFYATGKKNLGNVFIKA